MVCNLHFPTRTRYFRFFRIWNRRALVDYPFGGIPFEHNNHSVTFQYFEVNKITNPLLLKDVLGGEDGMQDF